VNKLKLQLKLQLKNISIVLLLLLLAILLKLTLSQIPYLDVMLVSITAISILNFKLVPYFISFGLTRSRYLINNTLFNLIISLLLSLVMNFTYFFFYSTGEIFYYLGVSSINYSLHNLLKGVLLYFIIFTAVLSAVSLICYVFASRDFLDGVASILLVLSVPSFFLQQLFNFFIWGEGFINVVIGVVIFIGGLNLLTYKLLGTYEIST
jgi:hypothetical protein